MSFALCFYRICLLPGLLWLAVGIHAAPAADWKGEEITLNGLRVRLGAPVRVTSQLGWEATWSTQPKPTGMFSHPTPVMARFPGGCLIATYAMTTDTQDDPLVISAFQISSDEGRTWGRRCSAIVQHNPMIFIPLQDDSLLGIPSELNQRSRGDDRNFTGTEWLFRHGGRELLVVPEGVQVLDWPWALANFASPQPPENWQAGIRITGSVTKLGRRWLITAEVQKKTDPYNRDLYAVVLASEDQGRNWRYFSTLGEPDRSLESDGHYEGPNEPFILPLADGTLMGVYRIGTGHLQRAYSADGGRTWSPHDSLPAWAVKPQLVRMADGTIALSTGRPGIYLWLSTDAKARSWQSVDLVAHHNRFMSDAHDRILRRVHNPNGWQTSSYTGLVDMGGRRLLIAYDRTPEEPPTDNRDFSSVYVVPVEVVRR